MFAKHGPKITEHFYASLEEYPKTAKIIEGRVEKLKSTHQEWMRLLFEGEYDRSFFDRHFRIGKVHVEQGINPEYVEAVMSVLRTYGRIAIYEELGSNEVAASKFSSLCKALDMAAMSINMAYATSATDARVALISKATGMSVKLIENLMKRGAKQS